ncbi:hypothetical protein MMC13_008383 [Lambiella insularis]|nr:hypothetical protein [Lambiella insularis]
MHQVKRFILRPCKFYGLKGRSSVTRLSTRAALKQKSGQNASRGVEPVIKYANTAGRKDAPRVINIPNQESGEDRLLEIIFLRDSCACHLCVDSSTSQKLFDSADIPLNIDVQDLHSLPDGGVQITWNNDVPCYYPHTSTYSSRFLSDYQCINNRIRFSHNFPSRIPWDNALIMKKNAVFTYEEFISSDAVLWEGLNHLHCYGLLFIESIPSDASAIERIASRIGTLRNTFYGATWDVRSVPSAKNVAYTSQYLGFHMDLLYMADPPGLQILHTMKASTYGGESLFSDGLQAYHRAIEEASESLGALHNFQITYRYKNDGQWYQHNRPTVENPTGFTGTGYEIPNTRKPEMEINWSPPFQGPLEVDIGRELVLKKDETSTGVSCLRNYIHAAKRFKTFLEADNAVFETRMEQGTCVVFDNRRILHARKAFSSSSVRWLRGAYLDKDPFKSRLRILNGKFGRPDL